jgi:hypothetical protein
MPLYLKIGLLTCAFYLGVLALMEIAKIILVHWLGGWGISYSGQRAWLISDAVFYGLIWLGSFLLVRQLIWRTLQFPSPGGSFHVGG